MGIKELTRIVRPPKKPSEVPAAPDWKSIEDQLRLVLPSDYKQHVETYGSGLLCHFIRVFNPFSSSPYLALIPCVREISATRRQLKESEGDIYVNRNLPRL